MLIYKKSRQGGFTLIEMLIAVLIVGILMAVVVPSYQSSLAKSRRADARNALMELATKQELFFAQNSKYTTEISDAGTGLGLGRTSSEEGYYGLTATACSGGNINRCYQLRAQAKSPQKERDPNCYRMFIDNTGKKWSKKNGGAETEGCW